MNWEYRVLDITPWKASTPQNESLQQRLDVLGSEGWELVSVTPTWAEGKEPGDQKVETFLAILKRASRE